MVFKNGFTTGTKHFEDKPMPLPISSRPATHPPFREIPEHHNEGTSLRQLNIEGARKDAHTVTTGVFNTDHVSISGFEHISRVHTFF